MASYDTYTGLKALIASWLDRSDLTSYIPDWIDTAEKRLARLIKPSGFEATATGNLVSGTATVARPTRFKSMRTFSVTNGSGEVVFLKKRTYDFVKEYWPDATDTGIPKYYAEFGTANFILAPTPSSNLAYTMLYFEKLAPLVTTTNETNYLTTDIPDALLYASLLESAPFLKNDARIQTWEKQLAGALESIGFDIQQYRRDEASS